MRLVDCLNKEISFYHIVRLRHRYIFTSANKLRLRYVVSAFLVFSLTLTSFFSFTAPSSAFSPMRFEIAALKELVAFPRVKLASVSKDQTVASSGDLMLNPIETIEEEKTKDAVSVLLDTDAGFANNQDPDIQDNRDTDTVNKDNSLQEKIVKINPGDTVAGALQNIGISGVDAYRAIKLMSKYYNPRSIKPGQAISVSMEHNDNGEAELLALKMKIDPTKEIIITRDENRRFFSELKEKKIILQAKAAKASIETSLYGSAARAGIPASIVAEMIRIYSYDIDFQRDIRRGDKVEVLYEMYETEDGDFARYGNVLYANLKVGGKEIPVYRYKDENGIIDYYRENGTSLKRILMQTPIDGARMSSGFGMRRHPVLGYNKMHKGVDFAAPRGTPIYAAGSGVIEKAGRNGGYGNYIRIRHNNGLKTAYAHMKKFAKGIKVGKRVEQGNIIGYVGTTGRSTGPHLHFEVLKNGKQVNPKSIKSSSGKKLTGVKLKNFKARILAVKQQYTVLAQSLKFAFNDAE